MPSRDISEDSLNPDYIIGRVIDRSFQNVHIQGAAVCSGMRLDVFVNFTTVDNSTIVCRGTYRPAPSETGRNQ